jgi:hypothetical protein
MGHPGRAIGDENGPDLDDPTGSEQPVSAAPMFLQWSDDRGCWLREDRVPQNIVCLLIGRRRLASSAKHKVD